MKGAGFVRMMGEVCEESLGNIVRQLGCFVGINGVCD